MDVKPNVVVYRGVEYKMENQPRAVLNSQAIVTFGNVTIYFQEAIGAVGLRISVDGQLAILPESTNAVLVMSRETE